MHAPSSQRPLGRLVVAITLSLAGLTGGDLIGQQSPRTPPKIDGRIARNGQLKIRPAGRTEEQHQSFLHELRLDAHDLLREEVALYLDEPLSASERQQLAARGVDVHPTIWVPPMPGKHPYGFHMAEVRYDSLDVLQDDARIKRVMSAEERSLPQNGTSTAAINVDQVQAGLTNGIPRSGNGVRIAVADSSLDVFHPDVPTIVETWDMTDGTSTADWGTWVGNTASNHGTHVTGSAVGTGAASNGTYTGSAPGALLHFYKIGDNCKAQASGADQIEAMNRAAAMGCDVFSMSYSTGDLFRDGSDPLSQTVDSIFASGTLPFISAANSADDEKHDGLYIQAGSYGTFSLTITNDDDDLYLGPVAMKVIWRDSLTFDQNISLTATNLGLIESLDQVTSSISPRGTEARDYDLNTTLPAGITKTYTFTLTNNGSSGTPLVHVYVGGKAKLDTPSASYTVGVPALADDAIAVGAWTSNNTWTDFNGTGWTATGETVGTLASFSSQGPRVDGALKPDLVAPGVVVISMKGAGYNCSGCTPPGCGGTYPNPTAVVDNDGLNLNGSGPADYIISSGTSMATPLAAGAACLLIEENPSLAAWQIRDALRSTASQGGAPDNQVGWGMVDAAKAYTVVQSNVVWVDFAYAGLEFGTYTLPFNDVGTAVASVPSGWIVRFMPGSSPETLTTNKALRFDTFGGTVVVGE